MDKNKMIITSPLFPNQMILSNPSDEVVLWLDSHQISQNRELNKDEVSKIKLKKDGTIKNIKCNKQRGSKSEVYPFEIEDVKKIINYFYNNQMWQCYLIFVIQCNTARRIGDLLKLQWKHFFNPATGKIRADLKEFKEQKTDKLANPRINSACRKAIELYIEKTGVNPADDYEKYVFTQTSGNYKGRVITADGYRKPLKKAAVEVGIEYNVGTHSARKFFGKMSRMLHPGDCNSMEILQTIYNHSSEKITKRYIGITKETVDKYYDDIGEVFEDYVIGGKTYENISGNPIVSLDTNDLRDIIKAAYKAGQNNAGKTDAMVHLEAINEIMAMIESLSR